MINKKDRDHDTAVNAASPSEDGGLKEFDDVEKQCMDCQETFIWSAGEQSFFAAHQLSNPPKRCKPCKRAKSQRIAAIEESKLTGTPAKIVVEVTCHRCGNLTTVPFYPSQGRPVYCRDCYAEMRSDSANVAAVT
jgi:CxxC-x17-CxxC domain-containing protein